MPISAYMANLRIKLGVDLLLMPAAGAAVFDTGGRLLLARHVDDGLWATVGGGIEPGERPAEAALRELVEETGLQAEILGIVGAYGGPDFEITYPGGDRVAYVVTMYACRLLAGEVTPDYTEVNEVGWFGEQEAQALSRPSDMKQIIPDAFQWWATNRSARLR